MNIVIIDYGLGNLKSVYNSFRRVGHTPIVSNERNVLRNADKLVLPGVGHFKQGMANLRQLDLIDELNDIVLGNKKPILGICLGLQLFTAFSEEGGCEGLNYISNHTKKFPQPPYKSGIKIPHMGWNTVVWEGGEGILTGITAEDSFYFVHSYFVEQTSGYAEKGFTEYGQRFVSVIQKENIYGTQFHPEKSHDPGLKILKNYCDNI